MWAEDEFELLKTLFLSVEIVFDHERHRVQLALIMQLAGITGNRPAALLGVCYKDIKITLLPDSNGGELPRLLIEIAFKNTKGYLGEKETSVLPFCAPFVGTDSFAEQLTSIVETSSGFLTPPGQKQLPLPLKETILHVPLFRRSKFTMKGVGILDDKALPDSTLRSRMITLGSVTGMELPTGPYTFRRGNGEALDNSSV